MPTWSAIDQPRKWTWWEVICPKAPDAPPVRNDIIVGHKARVLPYSVLGGHHISSGSMWTCPGGSGYPPVGSTNSRVGRRCAPYRATVLLSRVTAEPV